MLGRNLKIMLPLNRPGRLPQPSKSTVPSHIFPFDFKHKIHLKNLFK